MASASREVIASAIFQPGVFPLPCPVNPIAQTPYMRNARGAVNPLVPDSVAAGHYRFTVGGDVDTKHVSITPRATNAAGANRVVSVVLTRPILPLTTPTTVDVFVRDTAAADGVLSEDFVDCEVTIARLPL
jgi:hypothetical protein